jgi:hypothetical protein
LSRQTKSVSRRVRSAEAHSDYVLNHPPTAQFHRQGFIDVSMMGIPALPPGSSRPHSDAGRPAVRIVHAPSMAPWKGTEQIRGAISQLLAEGLAIDYVELSGVPHQQVMETLSGADLVVDELYSDAILAGLATEAAALGVTPLVFGYAKRELEPIAASMGVGLDHYAEPEQLVDVLRSFVMSPDLRRSVGGHLQDYVRRERSPRAVAERYRRLLEGNPEPAWVHDPADVRYVDGWGIERSARRALLRRFIDSQGVGALLLPDQSPVRRAILSELAPPIKDRS